MYYLNYKKDKSVKEKHFCNGTIIAIKTIDYEFKFFLKTNHSIYCNKLYENLINDACENIYKKEDLNLSINKISKQIEKNIETENLNKLKSSSKNNNILYGDNKNDNTMQYNIKNIDQFDKYLTEYYKNNKNIRQCEFINYGKKIYNKIEEDNNLNYQNFI